MFNRIRALEIMRDQGRKRSWLAEQLDVSQDTITRYLNGETEPTKATAIAWALYLNVSPEQLWDEKPKQKAS